MHTNEDIQHWNQQGLIPGPEETEIDFTKRTYFCLHLEQALMKQLEVELPFDMKDRAFQAILDEASFKTKELYGIQPTWTPLFFNNYQLAPWHGGCAWIFQLTENAPTAALLQLRAPFRHQPTYLNLYRRDELIAHELSHVGRMMYQEPQFEEILAYRTSCFLWRRWLGPIVQSSKESMFFILILAIIILTDFALMTLNKNEAYQLAVWLKLIPLALVGFALGRLGWRQWQFHRCLHQLAKIYHNSHIAQQVIYRLTDYEIRTFATLSPQQIRSFIQSHQSSSFRWKFLAQNYPLPISHPI